MQTGNKALHVCAGVDVMADRFEVAWWAFGVDGAMWPHAYTRLPVGPDGLLPWDELWALLRAPVCVAGVVDMAVTVVAIDSGGHHANEVYRFVRARDECQRSSGLFPRVFAIKCSSTSGSVLMRPGACDLNDAGVLRAGALTLWVVNMPALLAQISPWYAAQCPGFAPPDAAAYALAAYRWLSANAPA